MRAPAMIGSVAALSGFAVIVQLAAPAAARVPGGDPVIGPDVIVSAMNEIDLEGTIGGITGYSISTTSCNIGDMEVNWIDCTVNLPTCNQHPVIGQQLYRLMDGRFEQVGMSWLKHAFCALDEPSCGTCQPNFDCNYLAVGCADTYSANINSLQTYLGPRSEVNPATGVFPYPYELGWNQTGNAVYKRLQVHMADLDPALNPGARYFAEAQYITTDEQPWGNDDNNISYRELAVGDLVSGGYELAYVEPIESQMIALEAWRAVDHDVVIETIDIPDDGRLQVGYRATDNGDGTWHYEYAIYNMHADRAVQRVTVPLGGCVEVTQAGFHDVDYHSGEVYDGADWPAVVGDADVTWQTTPFDVDPLANALRFGTLYNFRFDADAPPALQSMDLGLFKPGSPASILVPVLAPQDVDPPTLAGDCGDGNGTVDIQDLLALLAQWGPGINPSCDIDPSGGDDVVGIQDLLALLGQWGQTVSCP